MDTVVQEEQQNNASTIVLSVMNGVTIHIHHDSLPSFMLMRSTQLQALTTSLLQMRIEGDTQEGAEWVLEEISSQLHNLIPHAISRSFAVSLAD